MLEAAFFRLDRIPRHPLRFPLQGTAVEIRYLYARRSDHCQIAIGKEKEIARVMKNRGDVGCNKIFGFPKTNDSRRSMTLCDDLVALVSADHNKCEDACKLLHCLTHCIFE